ncbi:tetratricopeptide repeat protein [Pseudoxanthomonas kalamensis]|uniref:tetratricopeptide repeat protein n=1 Tax=Pseudoxanthomonas kalamensis TaxID=289483 RepID=UPI001FE79358|nr:tetratricopeptide repeat protein [Pseudoxanthomonas kalamensis]
MDPKNALFAIVATCAALLAFGAVLWPLRRHARKPMLVAVAVMTLCAVALYAVLGTPAALQVETNHTAQMPASLDEAIARLQEELQRDPNQPEGWRLLARSQSSQGRHAEALQAYERVLALLPDDPEALTETAQARSMADPQKRFDATAVELLQRALKIDPMHQRATWFLGVWQRQDGRPADAAATWEPLLAQVDPQAAAALRQQIDEARTEAGLPPLTPAEAPAPAADTAGPHAIAVRVSLDPELAAREAHGGASVFVIARIPGGPPMPVAVQRHPLTDLPLSLTLGDGDSPMPTQKLSMLDEVEVFARLSASGSAMRQEGDVESTPVRVKLPSSEPVELIIGAPSP